LQLPIDDGNNESARTQANIEKINNNAQQSSNKPKQDSEKAFRPNGNQAKLAQSPKQNSQQQGDPQSAGTAGHLLDLNLGQPEDSGNLLDLPGLAAVGVSSLIATLLTLS